MELHQFFLLLAIILIAARLLSETAAFFGIPSMIGELAAGYFIREPRNRQTAIGRSMVLHGEVGLIFSQLGLSLGILNGELYAALLIVIALTTMSPPFLLKWFYGGKGEAGKNSGA